MNANNSQGDIVKIIADEILDYLAENPRSSDTIVGISRWWLQARDYSTAQITSALNLLVDDQKLAIQRRANNDVYYSLKE